MRKVNPRKIRGRSGQSSLARVRISLSPVYLVTAITAKSLGVTLLARTRGTNTRCTRAYIHTRASVISLWAEPAFLYGCALARLWRMSIFICGGSWLMLRVSSLISVIKRPGFNGTYWVRLWPG